MRSSLKWCNRTRQNKFLLSHAFSYHSSRSQHKLMPIHDTTSLLICSGLFFWLNRLTPGQNTTMVCTMLLQPVRNGAEALSNKDLRSELSSHVLILFSFLKGSSPLTKELLANLRRVRTPMNPACIQGVSVYIVEDYKYLGVLLDHKLARAKNPETL